MRSRSIFVRPGVPGCARDTWREILADAPAAVACEPNISYRLRLLDVSSQYPSPVKARSSVGERFLDTEEVGGSIPPVPTRSVPTAARANFAPPVSRND